MEELPEVDKAFEEEVGPPCSQVADGQPLPCEARQMGSCRDLG